jgi:hypothetical protein
MMGRSIAKSDAESKSKPIAPNYRVSRLNGRFGAAPQARLPG